MENNVEVQDRVRFQSSLSKRQVTVAYIGTMLSMFLGSIFMTITATAMPTIITDLGGFSQYTWVFTSYIIAETVSLPISGKLSDMYGRKWVFVFGMSAFIVGSFLSGISQSMTQLIIFRAFQGIGFGVISALGFIVIADIFPPEDRGKYGGMMAGVFGLSTLIGPTLGGFLTDALSWRWCFFVPIPVGVIIIVLFIIYFPQYRPGYASHKVDYLGAVLMTLFITPLILALTWAGVDYAWGSATILGLFAFSAVSFVLFLLVERRAGEPIVPLRLFRNQVVLVSAIVGFCTGAAFFPVVNFIPLFFQGVLGASATQSGSFMTPMMLSAAAGSFIAGQLLSRTGGHYRFQATVGFVLTVIGFFLLTRVTPETGYGFAIFIIVIIGIGNGMIMPVHTIAVQNTVPYAIMGAATSMINLLRPFGGVFGLAIVGSILNNRFASQFMTDLPEGVKAVVPVEKLNEIVENPQALVNAGARDELRGLFEGLGAQGETLLEQLISTLQGALNSALVQVFMVFLILTVVGMLVNFFLKGIPPHVRSKDEPLQSTED
jgi:EmrB/QacA subfamily drug resistance transporter